MIRTGECQRYINSDKLQAFMLSCLEYIDLYNRHIMLGVQSLLLFRPNAAVPSSGGKECKKLRSMLSTGTVPSTVAQLVTYE